jgi:hypothetical protein
MKATKVIKIFQSPFLSHHHSMPVLNILTKEYTRVFHPNQTKTKLLFYKLYRLVITSYKIQAFCKSTYINASGGDAASSNRFLF